MIAGRIAAYYFNKLQQSKKKVSKVLVQVCNRPWEKSPLILCIDDNVLIKYLIIIISLLLFERASKMAASAVLNYIFIIEYLIFRSLLLLHNKISWATFLMRC